MTGRTTDLVFILIMMGFTVWAISFNIWAVFKLSPWTGLLLPVGVLVFIWWTSLLPHHYSCY